MKSCPKCGKPRKHYTIPYCRKCWNLYIVTRTHARQADPKPTRIYVKGRTKKLYYEQHKQKYRERALEYYYSNREEVLERRRVWHLKNRDRLVKEQRKYRADNLERIRERERKYRVDNLERIRERDRNNWLKRKQNKDKKNDNNV